VAKSLGPLFKKLGDDELAEVAAIGSSLRQLDRPPTFGYEHSRPVEVIFARVNNEIVGALLLRRKWLEQSIPSTVMPTWLTDWLQGFGRHLGSLLMWEMQLGVSDNYVRDLEDGLQILERSADSSPSELERLWASPLMQSWISHIKSGGQHMRKRLRTLQRRLLTDSRGRPEIDTEDSQDVLIAKEVAEATSRLAEGFAIVERWKNQGFTSSREAIEPKLRALCYNNQEVDALLGNKLYAAGFEARAAVRPCRTLSGAAHRLVAFNHRRSVPSVRAIASRGRRKLNPPL
jgi:hypothetical protein